MKLFKFYSKKKLVDIILFQRQYINELEQDLFENGNNYVIPKKVIEEKIEDFKNVKKEILRIEKQTECKSITYDIIRNDYCEKMLEDLLKENKND